VPYRGAAPALQDLMGGRIDLLFDHLPNALPQVREGKVRAFAVTANTCSPTAPDIPTVDEAGLPGRGWRALTPARASYRCLYPKFPGC
jgi:tripartite-type tricarboxylate transporter receptor subunit TctC